MLLVTGRDSYAGSGAEEALRSSFRSLAVHRFYEFQANPTLEDVKIGVSMARQVKPDGIVAVGGGSVIDMAKAISILVENPGQEETVATGKSRGSGRRIPLLALPTTAGSGSEATHFAVVYVGSDKFSLADISLIPDVVLVDPSLSGTMSPRLTAVTGFDALSQGIESYWAVGANRQSRTWAAKAIKAIFPVLREAVRAPTLALRQDMAYGALCAGRAINISRTTAPHAISYFLTNRWGIPHGHAVALTLPHFLEVNADFSRPLTQGLDAQSHRRAMSDLLSLLGCVDPSDGARALRTLLTDVGLEVNPRDLGISRIRDIEAIQRAVNMERLSNNPVIVTPADVYAALGATFP